MKRGVATARLRRRARCKFIETGYVAIANHKRQWALKSRMILFSAWKGRTNSKRRFGEVGEKAHGQRLQLKLAQSVT